MSRKPLPGFGLKGRLGKRGRMVRGFLEHGRVVVHWRERSGQRRQESWPDTAETREEAKAYAEGVYERLTAKPAPEPASPLERFTVLEIWEKYLAAEKLALRGRTVINYKRRFGKFLAFIKPDTMAATVKTDHLDEFRLALVEQGHAMNQVAAHVRTVKQVFALAVERDWVPATKVATYRNKMPRDAKPMEIGEYTPAESQRIIQQADPRSALGWRPYVLATLFAHCGPRQTAARSLEWADVDFAGERIHWRPELDKVGTDRWQDVPAPVVEALWVAYGWRIAEGYTGRYILFGAQRRTRGQALARRSRRARAKESLDGVRVAEKPWTYQAFIAWLRRAEAAAGVDPEKYRGAHGFRRGVVTELYRRTKNLKLAADYIGDKDLRTVQRRYLKGRPEDGIVAAQLIDAAMTEAAPETAPETVPRANANATLIQSARPTGEPDGVAS